MTKELKIQSELMNTMVTPAPHERLAVWLWDEDHTHQTGYEVETWDQLMAIVTRTYPGDRPTDYAAIRERHLSPDGTEWIGGPVWMPKQYA